MARPDMRHEEVRLQPPRCIRLAVARLTGDRTPTAILTLTAQTHESFGMTELTRVEAAATRAKTSGFGAGMRMYRSRR